MHRRPRLRYLALLALLAGCSASVGVEAADDAADPSCAQVMVTLPDEIGEAPRRTTTSQSTAAWGDPPVVMRCGVEPPGPTTERCATFFEVDWVSSELDGGLRFVTYGRVPSLEVTVPDGVATDTVLRAVAPAADALEQESRCSPP